MTHEYIGTKIITAWPQEKDGTPGYAVKYADGYTSWSPKDVFEAAYIDIGHVSHLPAYQQRVIGERAELADKLHKLRAFMAGETFLGLPDMERFRLAEQVTAMDQYHKILSARIAAFSKPYMSSDATNETPLNSEDAKWKEAYENMRDWALANGLDVTCYNNGKPAHDSDCAQHNEPAKPNEPCDCSAADQSIEAEIQAKGLTAPRITPEHIDALMDRYVDHSILASGHSACVSAENFDAAIGYKIANGEAEQAARDKLWELEGYALYRNLQGAA